MLAYCSGGCAENWRVLSRPQGYALPHAFLQVPVGGRDVTAGLLKLLAARDDCATRLKDVSPTSELARDLKEKLCVVHPTGEVWALSA